LRSAPEMIVSLNKTQDRLVDPNSEKYCQIKTPDYAKNQQRSIKAEYLVMVGICQKHPL